MGSVEILEVDELYSFIKKRNRIYIWTAADRNKGKIVDFEVSQLPKSQHFQFLLDNLIWIIH